MQITSVLNRCRRPGQAVCVFPFNASLTAFGRRAARALGFPRASALAGVYCEGPEQNYKELFSEWVARRPSYYPRGVIRSCSSPSVAAKACCGRVCLESTVATRFGPLSPCGG